MPRQGTALDNHVRNETPHHRYPKHTEQAVPVLIIALRSALSISLNGAAPSLGNCCGMG